MSNDDFCKPIIVGTNVNCSVEFGKRTHGEVDNEESQFTELVIRVRPKINGDFYTETIITCCSKNEIDTLIRGLIDVREKFS